MAKSINLLTDSETEKGPVHLPCFKEALRITGLLGDKCPASQRIELYVVWFLTVIIVLILSLLRMCLIPQYPPQQPALMAYDSLLCVVNIVTNIPETV